MNAFSDLRKAEQKRFPLSAVFCHLLPVSLSISAALQKDDAHAQKSQTSLLQEANSSASKAQSLESCTVLANVPDWNLTPLKAAPDS